jgi:hypothetical protein
MQADLMCGIKCMKREKCGVRSILGTNWTKAKWEGEAERKCKVGKAFEI